MKATRDIRVVALVALAALVSACGSDSSVGPARQATDLGQVLTEMTLPSFVGALAPDLSSMPGLSAPTPASCSYSGASQSFVCPPVTASGLTMTRSFVLLNTAGNPQPQFDPATTAAVRTTSATAGTIASAGSSLTVDGQQELTLSGLLTGIHVLNGTSVLNMHGTEAGTTDPLALSMTMTLANLVLPASRADKWPKSGSILIDLMDTFGSLPSLTTHIRITFNGTSKVAVVFSSDGFSTSCTMDLASQLPTCG